MDYIEAFKNLRTNNKYGRRSPHKAIMMLTVIELYEQGVLSNNEIYYDNTLKAMFLKVWNKVLPNEMFFHSEAYLPFWYLQSDSFWHIVPLRGKEDILSLMRDTHIKPSEAKLQDSVRYAELDEDLYFLMTLPSGRSSLKRALLETYSDFSDSQIKNMVKSRDNNIDNSISVLTDFERNPSKKKEPVDVSGLAADDALMSQFHKLNEDIRIVLNLQYFSFLKTHRNERDLFKEICPTVYDLLDKIINHPVKQGDISPSFAFTYDNFLSDLKISLMSEDGTMTLIDQIGEAIDVLRGIKIIDSYDEKADNTSALELREVEKNDDNSFVEFSDSNNVEMGNAVENRSGKTWSEDEEELITNYFQEGKDCAKIAELVGRTELAIKSRLAKLGLIEYTYGEDESSSELEVEHVYLDNKGNVVKTEVEGRKEKKQEEGWQLEEKENNKNAEELIKKIDKRWNDFVRDETEDKNIEEAREKKSKKEAGSSFSVPIGTKVRLLPSQIEGVVINHLISKSGERRIVIEKKDGSQMSAQDHPYLYEIVKKKTKRKRIGEARRDKGDKHDVKRKETERVNDGSIKEQFRAFLAKQKSESTVNGYTSTLDSAIRRMIKQDVDAQADSIFSYTTVEDVQICIDLLKETSDFRKENARRHNGLTAALNQYLKFVEERGEK